MSHYFDGPSQRLPGLKMSDKTSLCWIHANALLTMWLRLFWESSMQLQIRIDYVFDLSGNNGNSEFKFGEGANTIFCVFFCRWQDFYSISSMSSASWPLIQLQQSHLHRLENKWDICMNSRLWTEIDCSVHILFLLLLTGTNWPQMEHVIVLDRDTA